MGGELCRITDLQGFGSALDHADHRIGDILLHTQHAQGRTALPRRTECREHDIITDLFAQSRAVHQHHIDAAGFGNQRHNRALPSRQRAVDQLCGLGRTGKDHARHRRMAGQHSPHRPIAQNKLQSLGRDA